MPAPPVLTLEGIPGARAGMDAFMPRPDNEQLARGGDYVVDEVRVDESIDIILCRPAGGSGPSPVLYYIHGGGMVMGSPRDALGEVLELAASVGAAVASVGYRLAPETPFPGPLDDCYQGLTWVAEHADEYGLDPERIIAIGGSAGAGLAAGLTLLARDRKGPQLFAQVLMSPMLDDRNDSGSVEQMASLPMWNKAANEVGWSAYLGERRGGPEVSPYAAPARALDLSGLPPAFIDVGSADSFRDEDVAYAARIWAAGGVAEFHVWPGGFHGFDGIAPHAEISKSAVAARVSWLRRLLS
jgi:acetyl esterase/lipase